MTTTTTGSITRDVSGKGMDAHPFTRANILLVDDQPARLLTYEAVLSGLEVGCVRALSAAEALQHLLQQEFAVILLDVQMPEMDGFDLARMIREHPRLERTPIIFVTGVHVSEFDRLRGYEVGAIDYISVPVVPEILRSKVAVLVELHLKRRELQTLNRELSEMRSRVEREQQRVLVDDAPVAIGHCTLDGKLLKVNPAFCELVGYTAEELRGRRWQDITHPDDLAMNDGLARKVIDGELPHYTVQKRYVRKDGRVVWIKLYWNVLRDEAGRPVQGVAIAIDITDQIESVQALRESKERLMLAQSGARLGIFDWNLVTGAVTWDDRLHELWGTTPAEIDHVAFVEGIHPEDREYTLEAMNRAMAPQGDGHYTCVHRIVDRRDQSIRWVEASGKVTFEARRPVRFNGIVQDVTERKDAEARLQLIADRLPILISYVGADRRYQFCNASYCEWFGPSKASFVGQHAQELLGEQTYRDREPLIDRAMAGEVVSFEGPIRHRTLGIRHCETVYVPHTQGTKVHGVYVMAHDITERKQSEERVRESEKRFRTMADNSPVMIWVAEPDGSCSYLNRRWYEFTGQTPQESGARDWWTALHPEDQARVHDEFMRCIAARVPVRFEYRLRSAQGRYHWVIDAATPRFGDDGQFAGYIGSVIDISERKCMEEALREDETRFRALANAMPQIVFTADAAGVTDYFNERWYELTGLPPGTTDDEIWGSRLHPEDRTRALQCWYECVRSGLPYQTEYRLNFPEHGGYRWHLARALPVRNSLGAIVRWYGTCTDIHDLRLAQEALRQADRRKDEFLATLAHELRNPLAPIRSAVQFLDLQPSADVRVGQARAIIDRQSQVLVRLVDDLLDLSRITRGHVTLQRAPVKLEDVITSAIDGSRTLIETNRHELVVSMPQETIVIDGDSTRLAQIFLNLLHNAAKYTPTAGRIEISVARVDSAAVVSVRDNGIGIPEDMLESIFEMFTQVASSLDRAQGGLGIGLTLARQLTELHGGRIEARSSGIGSGAELIVTLPLFRSEQYTSSQPPTLTTGGPRRRVMIADDNADAARTLSYLLDMSGHEVRTASDGIEALKLFERYRPEIVLLDIGMPGMSGYEVASAIRSLPMGRDVLLVAVSGWGQENDRRASFAAGFDQHLTKPVDFHSLLATLEGAKASSH